MAGGLVLGFAVRHGAAKVKEAPLESDRPIIKTRPARKAPPQVSRYTAKVFEGLAQRTRFVDPGLAARWRELAGEELAALCRPGRLTGGRLGATLEVSATSAAAAARVQFEAEALRRRVNEYLGPGRIGRIAVVHRAGAAEGAADAALGSALSRFRASVTARKDD